MPAEKVNVYHAAEMFNLPARLFNARVVEELQRRGKKVFSPQRDGFEFTQLISRLQRNFSEEEIGEITNVVIFAFDVLSISKADLVLARVDEPPDPGVDTEILIADSLNIPVVAYRTDVRSPYGAITDRYAGMHSFPVKGAECIIIQGSSLSPEADMNSLIERIISETNTVSLTSGKTENEDDIPASLRPALTIAHQLFDGIEDIHSPEGLEEFTQRCSLHQEELGNFGPRVIRQ
jgi:nucleoside 2-deoxyribosyltransferase